LLAIWLQLKVREETKTFYVSLDFQSTKYKHHTCRL